MNSFRKHAPESTRRPNSLLAGRAGVAATLLILLAASAHTAAAQQRQAEPKAQAPEPAAEAKIPVRVRRVKTPEGPGVVATIGDFPADLNEAGQEFLKREFFEHFASDVLGLGDSDETRATLKIALLPQEKENQREGDFTFGKVSGHMVVLVERRRVLVACTFSEAAQAPRMLAGAGRFDAWPTVFGVATGQQKSDS